MVTIRDERGCCSVTFCPLELSFGMTLHTFQGQEAGPVDEGRSPNAVDTIIVEPGTRSFEGNNPGTAYMAISRATTMGTGNLDSAIYFTGPNMNRSRVIDILYQRGAKRKMYKKADLREKWVKRLEENTITPVFDTKHIEGIKQWCKEFRMNADDLDTALSRRTWRANMRRATNY